MEFPACSDLTESLKVSSWLRLDVWLSGMCSASCIGQPINGISRMDAFDTYFSGRGTKPVSVRMSRKEAWLGAYTHAPSGRFLPMVALGLGTRVRDGGRVHSSGAGVLYAHHKRSVAAHRHRYERPAANNRIDTAARPCLRRIVGGLRVEPRAQDGQLHGNSCKEDGNTHPQTDCRDGLAAWQSDGELRHGHRRGHAGFCCAGFCGAGFCTLAC